MVRKNVNEENFNILKRLRIDAGFSQVQLSRYTGISVSTIRKLESGERNLNKISLENAFKISVVLQFPMEYLLNTTNIKLNKRYLEYWKEYCENMFECFSYSHGQDKEYVKYSDIGNPYEILERIWEEELEKSFREELDEK